MIINKIKESSIHLLPINSFNSEFSNIELWLTDQNSEPLEIEEKININSDINWSVKNKNWHTIQLSLKIEYL